MLKLHSGRQDGWMYKRFLLMEFGNLATTLSTEKKKKKIFNDKKQIKIKKLTLICHVD